MKQTFHHKDLVVEKTQKPRSKPKTDQIKFGSEFSDHMLLCSWRKGEGWAAPKITPLAEFSLHPGSKVFHYAQEGFEGLKAYAWSDGSINMFRPELNMARMIRTAERSALPQFDANELLACVKSLVALDRDWVPKVRGSSLYIRPTMIGIEPCLGVAPSNEVILFVITGPVGSYFSSGPSSISLLADPNYVRSWPGGCGYVKMGANYAPTLKALEEATRKGCEQVLWLYGDEHYITEVGAMNILTFWTNEKGEKELVTAPTDELILPGITRRSILEIAKDWDEFKINETALSMKQLIRASKEDRLHEMFGAGTACVVLPIERIHYLGTDIHVPTMKYEGTITSRFFKELTEIQYGDRGLHPWIFRVAN